MKSQELNNTISNAIEQGYVIIYENVEEKMDFNVQTLLQKQVRKLHGKDRIRFMGQEYELNENFRFYMTTKLSRPHFSSEICVLSTILNFQVTAFGLEDQMLNILVAKEDPSSERMRINNIKEFYDLMKKQLQTEAKILSLLTESESDNILDDVNLIQAL